MKENNGSYNKKHGKLLFKYSISADKVRHDKRLCPLARLIYIDLYQRYHIYGRVIITNQKLAEIYGVSVKQISIALNQHLKKYGYIELKEDRKGYTKVLREIFIIEEALLDDAAKEKIKEKQMIDGAREALDNWDLTDDLAEEEESENYNENLYKSCYEEFINRIDNPTSNWAENMDEGLNYDEVIKK